jgi:hypothetical protein
MTKNIRGIRIEGNVAYVPLTKGYDAIIDALDVHLVQGFNWCASVMRHTVYALRAENSGLIPTTLYLHRLIMMPPCHQEVDHIDRNGLNNTRANLRVCTRSQNCQNQGISVRNSSGFKGVSWCARDKKWQSHISANGRRKRIGYFASAEDAYAAYCAERDKLHGCFGCAF